MDSKECVWSTGGWASRQMVQNVYTREGYHSLVKGLQSCLAIATASNIEGEALEWYFNSHDKSLLSGSTYWCGSIFYKGRSFVYRGAYGIILL